MSRLWLARGFNPAGLNVYFRFLDARSRLSANGPTADIRISLVSLRLPCKGRMAAVSIFESDASTSARRSIDRGRLIRGSCATFCDTYCDTNLLSKLKNKAKTIAYVVCRSQPTVPSDFPSKLLDSLHNFRFRVSRIAAGRNFLCDDAKSTILTDSCICGAIAITTAAVFRKRSGISIIEANSCARPSIRLTERKPEPFATCTRRPTTRSGHR